MNNAIQPPETIRWTPDGAGLVILDQTRLPMERVELELRSLEAVEEAIHSRIAANGDVANKVGTFAVALAAHHHSVPFYVLAPTSTVDLNTPDGAHIPIEHRAPDEVRAGFGKATAPPNVEVWSPAFDVTPASLVDGIVTEQGIYRPPYETSLRAAVQAARRESAG